MRKRNHCVSVWLDETEFAKLKELSKLAGMRYDPFLRALVLNQKIKAHPPEQWVDVVRQLSGIGTNINQIAHVANRTGQVHKADLDAIIAMQGEIWRWVKGL